MTSPTLGPAPAGGRALTRQIPNVAFGAIALMTVCALVQASMNPESVVASSTMNTTANATADAAAERLAQCDHDAGIAMEKLAAYGLDLRTPKWRRDRERAIRACRDGYPDLRWLNP